MTEKTFPQKQTRQTTMFGTYEFPSYEEIMEVDLPPSNRTPL